MTLIKTSRFTLRPIEPADAPRFALLCNDLAIARNTARVPSPYTPEDARKFTAFAAEAFAAGSEFPFAVCDHGKIIACAGLSPVADQTFDLGYWVGADYRGRGVAKESALALLQHAFGALNGARVVAGYFTDNPGSSRVLEKIGMGPTGETVMTYSAGRQSEAPAVRVEISAGDFFATTRQ